MKPSIKRFAVIVILALIACLGAEMWLARNASPQVAARYYSRNRTAQFFERSAAQSVHPHSSQGRQIRLDHATSKSSPSYHGRRSIK